MAWKDTAVAEAIVLDLIIKEMVKKKEEIPAQLVELVDNILMILSDIESLKDNRKANLKPLVHQALGLIIVLWRLYLKDRYPSIWPPPPLNRTIVKFVKTVNCICKLVARKCEKKFLKNKIFMVIDVGKVKKYLRKLDAAAKNIEGDPLALARHVVDVNAVLLEAINEYYNKLQDEEVPLLEVPVKVEDIMPEPVAEGSRRQAEIDEEIEEGNEVETSTQNSRETLTTQSSPPHPPRYNDYSFNNTGSGVMINRNIGNIYNSTITNVQVGNNNPENPHHHDR